MSSFIRPSRRGWMLAVNALLWYLIARINHNLIALILAWGSLSLLMCSFFMAFLALRKVRLRRGSSTDAQACHFFNLPLVCDNSGRFRTQPLVACEILPFSSTPDCETIVQPQPGRTSADVPRAIMPLRRGEFALSAVTLRDADPIGLFFRERQYLLPASVIVYPAFFPIDDLDLPLKETFTVTSAMSPITLSGNSQDFYGVREYHPTDGMKHIHWKSSAKYGKFMVREYERSATLPVAILLDGDDESLTPRTAANLECAISLAASVVQYLRNIRCNIAFAAGGDKILYQPPMTTPGIIPTLMMNLAIMKPGKCPFAMAVDALLQSIAPGTIIFAFTLSDSNPTRDAVDQLLERGYDVRWFVTTALDFHFKTALRKNASRKCAAMATYVTPDMTADKLFCQLPADTASAATQETR